MNTSRDYTGYGATDHGRKITAIQCDDESTFSTQEILKGLNRAEDDRRRTAANMRYNEH